MAPETQQATDRRLFKTYIIPALKDGCYQEAVGYMIEFFGDREPLVKTLCIAHFHSNDPTELLKIFAGFKFLPDDIQKMYRNPEAALGR